MTTTITITVTVTISITITITTYYYEYWPRAGVYDPFLQSATSLLAIDDPRASRWRSSALQTSPCVRRAIINHRKHGVATDRGKGNANREAPTALEATITKQGARGGVNARSSADHTQLPPTTADMTQHSTPPECRKCHP